MTAPIDPALGILPALTNVGSATFSEKEKNSWMLRGVFAAAFAYIAHQNKQKDIKGKDLTGISQYVGKNPLLAATVYLCLDLTLENYFLQKRIQIFTQKV